MHQRYRPIWKHNFHHLNITTNFWQLLVHPNAQPYPAFMVLKMGQFQWVTTPMELLGAPASFQSIMETMVHSLPNVLVYINNLLLHSTIYEDHLCQLDYLLVCYNSTGSRSIYPNANLEAKKWPTSVLGSPKLESFLALIS